MNPHRMGAFGVATAVVALALTACSASGSTPEPSGVAGTPTAVVGALPTARPAQWAAAINNPWFPLLPGSRWVYHGRADGEKTRDVMVVSHRTKDVDGITATVVHDNVYTRSGRLLERTDDWYAQDAAGNVWYLGEDTAELDKSGHVKTRSGSWETGTHGAEPGLIMPARPRVGQSYAQESFAGHAEDHAAVLSLSQSVKVPAAASASALVTKEWTPLEPDVVEHKYYVRGIGNVLARTVKGPTEVDRLVSFHRGSG